MKSESDEEFSEELNDKLNELWTGAAQKRREMIKNKTPAYSRRSDISQLNTSAPAVTGIIQKQVLKLREKLQQQVSVGRHKDIQIQNLKKQVVQLSNQKKFLLNQLDQCNPNGNQNCANALNQSSIHAQIPKKKTYAQQIESSHKKKTKISNKSKLCSTIIDDQHQTKDTKLQNLSKNRLLQLLRSTSQYRSFVFYYDSHELSYLKRLQAQHKKNCTQTSAQREKVFWAPTDLLTEMRVLNEKESIGLSQLQQQLIISRLKGYYQKNQEQKIKKMKQYYQDKLRKAVRESQNNVPYELVQICKAKQRELSKQVTRKRNNTVLK